MKEYCVFFWTVNYNIKHREVFPADTKMEAIEIAQKNRNIANGAIKIRKYNQNMRAYIDEIVIE